MLPWQFSLKIPHKSGRDSPLSSSLFLHLQAFLSTTVLRRRWLFPGAISQGHHLVTTLLEWSSIASLFLSWNAPVSPWCTSQPLFVFIKRYMMSDDFSSWWFTNLKALLFCVPFPCLISLLLLLWSKPFVGLSSGFKMLPFCLASHLQPYLYLFWFIPLLSSF